MHIHFFFDMKVECELFQDMRGQRLLLRSVKLEEPLVTDFMDKAMEIFKANTLGPQKYLNVYKKYADLLNNKAEQDVANFLKERHSLQGFKAVCINFEKCHFSYVLRILIVFRSQRELNLCYFYINISAYLCCLRGKGGVMERALAFHAAGPGPRFESCL